MSGLDMFAKGNYPDSWDEYIGQDQAKETLKTAALAAARVGDNMPHTLICAPESGAGKTALAQLAIRQMDRGIHVVSGAINLARARILFSRCNDGDVIFYDEFHKVMDGSKKNAEWLLHYLADGVLLTAFGEERVPQVTIIGATTDAGAIPDTIMQRFVVIQLDPYTDAEAAEIAQVMGGKVLGELGLPALHKDTADAIALASNNAPRMIRKLVRAVRDCAVTDAIETPDDGSYDLGQPLRMVGMTHDGLDKEMLEYLRILYVEAKGEPIGEAQLKRRMGTVGKGLDRIEKLMQRKDMVQLTPQGRMIGRTGIQRAAELFGDI